jgi:tRNA pseudouridine65 synthase
VFALDRTVAGTLAAAFASQQVHKSYLAIVRGWPAESGTIEYALEAVQDLYAPAGDGVAKPARTDFRRLATVELPRRVDRYPTARYALLELQPRTGRRHQLRRHLAHISHPIIGDSTYGKGRHNRLFTDSFGVARLLLACVKLQFTHPVTGEPLVIDADPGPGFTTLLEQLDWQPVAPGADLGISPVSP